jgi:hypothetical protein
VNHRLSLIYHQSGKPIFLGLLAWTLILFAIFQVLNNSLITPAAPAGIVSHQFAWTVEKAHAILASWAGRPSLSAAFSLGLDYLFMPSYALTVALGALLAAGQHSDRMRRLGIWAAYCVCAAALFDGFENVGQAQQLLTGLVSAPVVFLTGICASFKFGLLLLAILYGAIAGLLPKTR